MPPILIRTDAGPYGLGHVTRMRVLALALQDLGVTAAFVTTTPEAVAPVVRSWVVQDAAAWDQDLPRGTVLVIDTPAADWATDDAWLCQQQARGVHIVRVDHPDASRASCRLCVLPNAHQLPATLDRLRTDFGTDLHAGWSAVILDVEVLVRRGLPFRYRQHQIVFTAGGGDPRYVTQMEAWSTHAMPEVPKVYAWATADAAGVAWHPQYRRLLLTSVLAVGCLGQTIYECCYWQTPILAFGRTPADAARLEVLETASGGLVMAGGSLTEMTALRFASWLRHAWQSLPREHPPRPAGLDGQGAHRLAPLLLALQRS